MSPLRLGRAQGTVFRSEQRFRVLVAGRRFGKTQLALVELVRAAWPEGRCAWYVAPTLKQAKRIAWSRLKELTRPYWAAPPSETDLRIQLHRGGSIAVRGDGLDFVALDEHATMHRAAWTEVLRPALSDRRGRALFIGTPRGFNHFYDLYDRAQHAPDWAAFQFTTEQGGIVSREELASASRELDARSYRQEFQASFESLGEGRAYYAFERSANVSECRYRPGVPLIWSLDFNVNPLCSVLAQKVGETVYVLDELALPNSNTPAACEAFLQWIETLNPSAPIEVQVYGDATGESRSTSASRMDWQIIRDILGRAPERVTPSMRVSSSNPIVKDRVNCVNAMLCSYAQERRLQIHPKCRNLIRDLEQVCWKTDLNGNALPELDKSDPQRTHTSDPWATTSRASSRCERAWGRSADERRAGDAGRPRANSATCFRLCRERACEWVCLDTQERDAYMREPVYFRLQQTAEQRRRVGARGGRATARRRWSAQSVAAPALVRSEPRTETTGEAIAALDARFPHLRLRSR